MAGFGNIASNMVDAATEMAKQVGVEAVTSTFVSIRNLGENYERLKQDLLLLLALRDDKEREVQRNRHKDTSSAYRLWTTEVSETAEKVNCLINRYERERDSSNWIWKRSNLYTEMEKRLTQVQQLVGNGHSVDFLVDKPPDCVLKVFDAPQIAGYQTLQSTLENVIDLLRSNKISTIGVYGMKGVGKTAVMQNLNNHDLVAKLFDIVIYVRLSADHTDHELQCKIAKRLKLDTELINDPGEVAARIHEELQSKKYLLILVEVEDEINLTRLGIPCNDNQSKVVVTAQNSQVCTVNGADRLIKVGALSRDEAWKMFRNIVGSVIDFPDIEAVARRVCDKCSCLPLLIHKIARSFRLKRSASSWRVGLDDLEERWPDYENEGENELYSFLMFCYDELKDDNTKKCFLYASLYPANCKVYTDYLVECWAAQDFLGDVDDTRKYQKARDRGHAILEHLTDVSLLDEGKQMIYVTMNDCMKRLASHISSKNPECSSYIQTREKLEEGQESMSWKDARWVSMIDNNLQDLPTDQDCSTLSALLLQKNPDLSEIPSLFFKKHMRCLLVLDLYGTGIRQLPSTISKLTGLKGLYLNGCKHLTQLPEAIKSLVFLEFLDIRGTKVNFISPQIGYLTNLRCLRIPYIKNGDQSEDQEADTEPCPISRLTKLEELVIEVVSYQDWCRDAENVMAMLASLEHLTDLQCSFPSSNILERLLTRRSGRQFTSFRFFVGCQNSNRPQILESFEYRISKYIRYDNSKHENTLSISEVLPQTHAFELINFKDITELSHLGKENMEHIRGLSLEQCDEIHTLIAGNENGVGDVSTLPNLEQLHLTSLLKLNCVIRGPLHHGSLSKLKVLTLKNCPSLKSIFGNGAIQYLSELQILKIQGCPEFEELGLVNEIGETCVLPKLEMLMLVNLPRFMFVSTNDTLSWSSLEQVNVHRCPALKSLPFCKDNATNLRSIRGEQGWWNELQWTNKDHFQDMFLPSAKDFSDEQVLNYDQVFVRDFVPSALAFLLNGEGEIVKNFLLHTLQLQSWEKTVDCYSPRRGLMPASFKVRTVPLDGSIEAFEEVLDPDFGESAIGRVAPVDSGLWWIILLRAYVKLTGDYTLQERVEVQTGIRLILTHCLTDGFDMFPSLLVPDGSCMIDRRMGIHGHPLEIQALFYSALRCSREMLIVNDATKNLVAAINNRLSALSFHMREYYWVDMKKINEIYRYKTEEYSTDAVNKFNIYPEQIPSWLLEWIPEDGGYFIGNLQPAHMDFRFFTLGNLWAIVSSLGTARQNRAILNLIEAKWDDLVAQMPLKICYPALEGEEWRIITGSDPKNTSWSYHNGGSWPDFSGSSH